MSFFKTILLTFMTFFAANSSVLAQTCSSLIVPNNKCINFSIGKGTGCQWMCQYCAENLGTTNYYFTTPVCTYETGGCVGSPQPSVTYTCCSV